jgi:glutamate synthase (ferredoxin)
VVEGIGDHGCEYMTGGVAVILGKVGRNFGAGMSGGIAYVYDVEGTLSRKTNMDGLLLDPITEQEDEIQLRTLIENHYNATQSPLAQRILEDWSVALPFFTKVLPDEYKQALIRLEKEKKKPFVSILNN